MGWACTLKEFKVWGWGRRWKGEVGLRKHQKAVSCCGGMSVSCDRGLKRNLQRAVSATTSPIPPTVPEPPNALLQERELKTFGK